MNAFVKGIDTAQAVPFKPEEPKSLLDLYDDATLYLLHAKSTLFLAEVSADEALSTNTNQLKDCIAHAYSLLGQVHESVTAIVAQINTGEIYLKKINQFMATTSLLINGGCECIKGDTLVSIIQGLCLPMDRLYDHEINGLWQLVLKSKTKEEIFH